MLSFEFLNFFVLWIKYLISRELEELEEKKSCMLQVFLVSMVTLFHSSNNTTNNNDIINKYLFTL